MNTGELSPTAAELDEEMFVFNYEHSYNSRWAGKSDDRVA